MDIAETIYKISLVAVPAILAITLHEAAHGFIAWKLGDDTAYRLGRVTFNPIRHVDPFGTVLLPGLMYVTSGFIFGWAKPVPVDFGRLRNPRRDMVWVALAGPGTNVLLAIISGLLIHLVDPYGGEAAQWLRQTLAVSILVNVILAVFNMIPLPPLDGGRVAVGILPDALAYPLARMERYGILVLLLVVFLLPFVGQEIGVDLNVLGWVLWPAVDSVINLIAALTGID